DISLEGMFRGTPARRPSHMETKALLDASSLIDLEHGQPLSFEELDKVLREHHARLVLTRTNVLGLSVGAQGTDDYLELRDILQKIERLPHVYLGEGRILYGELKEAVAAFNERREFTTINPLVKRWDETLVLYGPSPAEMLVNQRLDDFVFMHWKTGSLRLNGTKWADLIRGQFEQDRKLPTAVRKSPRRHFPMTVRMHLAELLISFPEDKVQQLAHWIYENPARCPGFRFAYEWRQELMNNLNEKVTENDISDRTYAMAIPYVDATTLDRNTADLCRRVSRRLHKQCLAIKYEDRIFASLKELLNAKF
ncbi:MAG: hypothetical protein ACRD2O_01560, partial [Terriglobia bacterium]